MEKVVRTVCQGCHSECGVLVHLENGKIEKIKGDPEHPDSRGYICVKGIHYAHFVYHPDRLKYPLKRAGGKGEGRWKRMSWDRALDEYYEIHGWDRLTGWPSKERLEELDLPECAQRLEEMLDEGHEEIQLKKWNPES